MRPGHDQGAPEDCQPSGDPTHKDRVALGPILTASSLLNASSTEDGWRSLRSGVDPCRLEQTSRDKSHQSSLGPGEPRVVRVHSSRRVNASGGGESGGAGETGRRRARSVASGYRRSGGVDLGGFDGHHHRLPRSQALADERDRPCEELFFTLPKKRRMAAGATCHERPL